MFMALLLLLCLLSTTSASTVISVDSRAFFSSEPEPPSLGYSTAAVRSYSRTLLYGEPDPEPPSDRTFLYGEPDPEPPSDRTFSHGEPDPEPPSDRTFLYGEPDPEPPSEGDSTVTVQPYKPSDKTIIPVDSQTFFNGEAEPPSFNATADTVKPQKLSDLTVIPVESHTFFSGEPHTSRLSVAANTVQNPTPSDLTVLPVDSQTFFTAEPELPRPDAFTITDNLRKPSDLVIVPVESQTFFNGEPEPTGLHASNITVTNPKPSDLTVIPVDSQNFFNGETKTPTVAVQHPKTSDITVNGAPKHTHDVPYCSVYLRKEDLNKGTTLCPVFAPQASVEESKMTAICQQQSTTEKEQFKFCSSSYHEIANKVTQKLGKNKLLSSDRVEFSRSTIRGILKISSYGKAVICHRAQHVGFYCRQIRKSSVFSLSLKGLDANDQKSAKMLAVCHDDTSSWSQNRLVFKLLNVEPGASICHVLPSYDLVWLGRSLI